MIDWPPSGMSQKWAIECRWFADDFEGDWEETRVDSIRCACGDLTQVGWQKYRTNKRWSRRSGRIHSNSSSQVDELERIPAFLLTEYWQRFTCATGYRQYRMVLSCLFVIHVIEEILFFRFSKFGRYVFVEIPFLLIEKGFPIDTRTVVLIRNENTGCCVVMTGDRHR